MWQFEYLWLLVLLPLPWLVYRLLPAYREARSAVRVPFFKAMLQAIGATPDAQNNRHDRWQLLLNLLIWALLLLAAARPVEVEKPIVRQQPVRDMMLAIDISQSMETRDYRDQNGELIDRLSAVKAVVKGFIDKRQNDRIGLIVFGSGAFAQAPMTLDHSSLDILLDETAIGMAGPNTAIGDAIGLSIKLLDAAKEREKVLILLTDGNDTSSAIEPQHAAIMAKNHDIVIHTIAIGDPKASGEDKVDLTALKRIARTSNGRFFRADDSSALEQVYATLDAMTPHDVKTLSHQPKRDWFWLPLGAALLLLCLYHLLAIAAARLPRMHPHSKES